MNGIARIAVWTLAVLLVMAPIVGLLNGWFAADSWPLKRLRLTGEYVQVSEEAVRAAVNDEGGVGFFAVDLDRVRTRVEALPWVRRAEVRKSWPDTLDIRLVEYRAIAHWGDDRLLSAQGHLFSAPQQLLSVSLPRLSGPDDRIQQVVDLYRRAGQMLAPANLTVTGVTLDARGSWTLRLDNDSELVVGRGNPDARLGRFARAIPKLLASETRHFASADLRYSTGFALSWQTPSISPEALPGSTPES